MKKDFFKKRIISPEKQQKRKELQQKVIKQFIYEKKNFTFGKAILGLFLSINMILLGLILKDTKFQTKIATYSSYGGWGKRYSFMKRFNRIVISHAQYRTLTGEEIVDIWNKMYWDIGYKKNGAIKFEQADCVSAVFHFLKELGFNEKIMSIQAMDKRIKRLYKADLIKFRSKRRKYRDVEPGDLILFYPPRRGKPAHIGVVYGYARGKIKYVDVNGATGRGDNTIYYSNRRINKVVEVSIYLWMGKELLKELNAPNADKIISLSRASGNGFEGNKKNIDKKLNELKKKLIEKENKKKNEEKKN